VYAKILQYSILLIIGGISNIGKVFSGHKSLNCFVVLCDKDIANKFQTKMVSLKEMLIGDVKEETEENLSCKGAWKEVRI
jgi:hypothetical protein